MEEKIWVTCPKCFHKYLAIRKDGKLYVRKHTRYVPDSNAMGITILPGKRYTCEGSYKEVSDGR